MHQGIRVRVDAPDWSHQPLQQINGVDRLIHEHAATIKFPGTAPFATVVIRLRAPPGHSGVAKHQSTKSLLLYQVIHLAGGRIEAVLADDGQLHAGLLLHAQHLRNRRATDLHRFLDDHMPP